MRLKVVNRISARQLRRNPSMQALVEEALERYKDDLKTGVPAHVVEKVVYRDRPAAEPVAPEMPRGWFLKLIRGLGMENNGDYLALVGDIFPEPDAPRAEVANTQNDAGLKRLLVDLDKAVAAMMTARDELRRKMTQDTQFALRERERQR